MVLRFILVSVLVESVSSNLEISLHILIKLYEAVMVGILARNYIEISRLLNIFVISLRRANLSLEM